MIEHNVNNDTRDRNVEPERKGPARDPPVPIKIAARRTIDGHHNQWDDYYGQNDMADQNHEVKRTDSSLPWKRRIAMVVVIGEIRSEEYHRGKYSSNLAIPVRAHAGGTDEAIAGDQ